MKIKCTIVTDAIRNLAKSINKSNAYTCNLVSVWQTKNNSADYPTANQLKELLKENKEEALETYFAIPNYEVIKYEDGGIPIKHTKDGKIQLMKLPKDNPMEYFYNMYEHLPELRELIATPEEAYRFMLWREMGFIQNDLEKKFENRDIVEKEAINKAKEWRKKHPIKLEGIKQKSTTKDNLEVIPIKNHEILSLYENNSVVENYQGIKIPLAIGVSIKMPNALGGNTYIIDKILSNDMPVRVKAYDREGKYLGIMDFSYGYFDVIGNIEVYSPSGVNITNIHRDYNKEEKAFQEVKENHTQLEKDLGGGETAKEEIKDTIKVAKKGMSFEEALSGQESFFTKEEQEKIKQGLNGRNLQVMSVSRQTDPAFFSKEIVDFLEENAKKDLSDPTRVTAIEIWSKHDGLPIVDILEACKKYRVAPMVSFSITGLGGTALEGGVMKYKDMLQKVGELIKNGTLNAITTTIRIDPILPGVTNMEDIKDIVQTAKSFGIKKFVTSLVQSYGYTEGTSRDRKVISGINNALATEGKTYDWDKYYGRDKNNKINFKPKQQYINEVGEILLELNKDPEITIQTCAFGIKGLPVSACLDPMIIERVTGVDVTRKDGTYDRDTSRPDCMCYGCHGDFFRGQNKKCFSSCAYCYAAHSGDNKLNYYNEDGTLKDNKFTQTSYNTDMSTISDKSASFDSAQPSVTANTMLQQPVLKSTPGRVTSETQLVTPEDQADVDKVPEIGLNVLSADPDNPISKLARDFTPEQRAAREEMLARSFSGIVDRAVQEKIQEVSDAINAELLKDEPDRAELARLYEKTRLYEDAVKGRQSVIEEKSIQQIFKEMQEEIQEEYLDKSIEELDEEYGEGQGEYLHDAYQKVMESWEALIDGACMLIEGNENIRISTEEHSFYTSSSVETVLGGRVLQTETDEQNEEDDFGDDEEGNRADGNGGWSYKVRFVDPLTSLSKRVKKVLSNIVRIGTDGVPEVDDLGNIKYLNPEYAHAALINDLSSMVNADDFVVENPDGTYNFPAFEKLADKYPWMSQLINALQADPSLASLFYSDFRKDFIPYWLQYYQEEDPVKNKKAGWRTMQINKAVAFDSTRTSLITNYEQGNILDEDSLYGKDGKINIDKAQVGLDIANDVLTLLKEFYEEDYDTITDQVAKALNMVGFNSNKYIISNLAKTENGVQRLRKVTNALRNIFESVESMPEGSHLISYFSDDFDTIAREVGLVTELDNVASFRNGDKTYYSYSAPNYLDTMFKTLKSDERRDSYIQNQFGKYEWFKNQKNGQWRNEWIKLIEEDEDVRDQRMLKELLNIGGTDYRDWHPAQIKEAFIREYFSVGYNPGSKKQFAWYNFPIFSDSPIVKFIKFLRYTTDDEGTFKDKLLPLFREVVKQEIYRINLVKDRKTKNIRKIANFDGSRGEEFCFFPELNQYDNGTFFNQANELINDKDFKGLDAFIDSAVSSIMGANFKKFLGQNFGGKSITDLGEYLKGENVITTDSQMREALEEYFWNQAFATTQIIQLTTTDLAYYRDGTDFQKRYKEVYAAGTKLNTNSKYGRKIERTIYLADQIVMSSSYHDIKVSLNKAVKLGHIQSYDRDNILNKFKEVNVTDAQAYRSLSSMRAVLDMMGVWTPEMQAALDRFDRGEWDMADFNIVWQTIKPFVYTQIEKPDGKGGKVKVPHQNKNSEFLLLAMYQTVANSMGKSSKLRAINKFMEDNEIDVVQFESAVKAGGQGIIDIGYSDKKLQAWKAENKKEYDKVEKAAKTALKEDYDSASDIEKFRAGNDYLLDEEKITQNEYNNRLEAIEPEEEEVLKVLEEHAMINGEFIPEVVHEIPYDDYVVQQPTPEHLFDCSAVYGSQFRNLIISDMPNDPDFRITVNGKDLTKQEVINLYQSIITENLLEDFSKVIDKFDTIEKVQKAILDVAKGNPKYGKDIVDALKIVTITNPNTGKQEKVFNIPLDNPTTSSKVQEIITSLFKNGITKQHIRGASCILVSDYGLTKELKILHNKETGAIEGIECYLPAYSKDFYAPFLIEKKGEDGKTYYELDVNRMPQELRKIIGYRIPTEDKYSMAPLIIKGFLPQQNGSCIMLPADITTIAGSDFDVDKMFLMIPEFKVQEYNMRKAREDFAKMNEVFKNAIADYSATELAQDLSSEDPKDFQTWFNLEGIKEKYKYDVPKVKKIKYDMEKLPQEQNRKQRNNMLIDISWGILTHEDTAEKIHNPGNFDKAKIAARIAVITNDPDLLYAFARDYGCVSLDEIEGEVIDRVRLSKVLLGMSKSGDLKSLDGFLKKHKVEKSQLTIDTFIYNHKQNMTGDALIGMYANNTSMQAKYQTTDLAIKEEYTFYINGNKIQSLHDIISPNGERISKNCANFSAASVDNVKDPVLADLLQNPQTANVTGFMLRAGMSIEEIGLLFTQPVIRECIEKEGNLSQLGRYLKKYLEMLKKTGGYRSLEENRSALTIGLTSEELLMNCINGSLKFEEDDMEGQAKFYSYQISAGLLMENIVKMAGELSELTKISRADSPNGAINISIAAARNQVHRVRRYSKRCKLPGFPFTGTEGIIKNEVVTPDMSKDQMRERLMRSKTPILQAFYSLGIESALTAMSPYFSQTTPYVESLVSKLYANAPYENISDGMLKTFYNEYIEFALSKTSLFGNDENSTFDEKRDYYLYKFPKKFIEVIATNPDIAKMNIFKKIIVKDGDIIMERSGRLTPLMKASLMRDFDMLLYMDNPEAQKLAIDLFMYSFYKDGFNFGPNNFGTFFSSNFISSFPEVVDTLRKIKYNAKQGTYFDEFLPQFYANHYKEGIVQSINSDPTTGTIISANEELIIPSKMVLNKNLTGDGKFESYQMIYHEQTNIKGDIISSGLYVLVSDSNVRAVYKPAVVFSENQKGKRGVKYNANMSAAQMGNIETSKNLIESNKNINRSISAEDSILGALGGIEDALGFDAFEAKLGGINIDNAIGDIGPEKKYDESAGEAQLQEPLCK